MPQFDYRRFLHANAKIMEMLELAKRSADVMIDRLPAVFVVVDDNGEILRANAKLAELFGDTMEGLRGRNITEILSEEDGPVLLGSVAKAILTGGETMVETPIRLKPGETVVDERHFNWKVSVYSESPHVKLIGILGTDITESRRIMIRSIIK